MILTWFAIRTVDGVFIGNLFTRHALGVGIEPNSTDYKKWDVTGWRNLQREHSCILLVILGTDTGVRWGVSRLKSNTRVVAAPPRAGRSRDLLQVP